MGAVSAEVGGSALILQLHLSRVRVAAIEHKKSQSKGKKKRKCRQLHPGPGAFDDYKSCHGLHVPRDYALISNSAAPTDAEVRALNLFWLG